MISVADVGVGIISHEGTQAVAVSDFAIGRFRFLRELLFLHGRFNYIRISYVIFYFLFKSLVVVLPQFLFLFSNSYSGASLYDSWVLMMYNLIFTSIPILIVGVYYEDFFIQHEKSNKIYYIL